MASLQAQWQEQRQHRQAEILNRQQQVQDSLAAFSIDRTIRAAQMRDDLSQFTFALQQDTQSFLNQTAQERQMRRVEVAEQLHQFVESLQAETAEFLSLTAADRVLMAQEVSQTLSQFHVEMQQAVAELRSDLQARVQALQTITQVQLAQNCHDRFAMSAQQRQELTQFVQQLQADVETYLLELDVLRQERIFELRHLLEQSQQVRLAAVDELFAEFAEFRVELQAHRSQIQAHVWGSDGIMARIPVRSTMPPRRTVPTPVVPVASAKKTGQPNPQPASRPAVQRSAAPTAKVAVKSAIPRSSATAQSAPVRPIAQPVVQPVQAAVATMSAPIPAPVVDEVKPAIAAISAPAPSLSAMEQAVYTCLQQAGGLRLNEIESQLNLSRVQAVDAMRSLICNGQVVRRDGVYVVHEVIR